jgi:hypothetical protein
MAVVDEERDLLVGTTREVLQQTPAAEVMAVLDELGWFDLRRDDRATAEGLLFELQGEVPATSAALNVVVAEALGEPLAEPAKAPAVAVPIPGRMAPPAAVRSDGRVEIDGLLAGPFGDEVVVPLSPGEVLTVPATALEISPVEGIDPWIGWSRARGTIDHGHRREAPWEAGLAVGRRALAHELVGVARAMLSVAVDHGRERHQFGRPVGSFQALQHRLADVQVAIAAAELAAGAAWEGDGPLAARLAKILAGVAARTAAKHCQQVCGGMGFTWEHPLHRYVRRGIALDQLLGSAQELQRALGDELRRGDPIPRLVHL